MSFEQILKEVENLPTQERWTLASEIMRQLDIDPSWPPLPDQYFDELDRRMDEYRKDPSKAASWETVKARILSEHGAS